MPAYCDGVNRREFLRVGSVAGLSLAQMLRLQHASAAESPAAPRRDVNCIFLFLLGGVPQQDMWDLKPQAPVEIRGDFKPIDSAVPGMQVSDIIPKFARVTDKLALLRSMTHGDSDHGRGIHKMMTGVNARPADFDGNITNNNQHPSYGSMVARLGRGAGSLPPYISLPTFLRSGGPDFLGASCSPFVIETDPASPEFAVRDIALPTGVTTSRSQRRQQALREINRFQRDVERVSKQVRSLDTFYEKAYNLMTSREAKQAFDIQREKESVREAYSMTSVGQSLLMSRRLVEAGCRFVSVEYGHWDTHRKNTMSLRKLLVPAFDQALPALLTDLQQRGLLESTMVIVSTEFGRTPRINPLAGRDHWPNAFTTCVAGAGLKVGQVIGATDSQAAYVADRPIQPQDLGATMFHVLGIDPTKMIHTPLGRPIPIGGGGTPIAELL